MTLDTAFDEWTERARNASIAEVARRVLRATLKKVAGNELAGPCPRCGGTDRFSVNTRKGIFYCRGAGIGGDVIRMVEYVRAVEYVAACEVINGEPPPDRESKLTDEDRERLARMKAEREAADAQREAEAKQHRERERKTLHEVWDRAEPRADLLDDYLALRLGPAFRDVPPEDWPRLRLVRDMPYYRHGADRGEILARAPAMVAPLIDAGGTFRGLHFTYIDLAQPNGKLRVPDPDKPDDLLPAKKVRGSKQGNVIDLFPRRAAAARLVLGEGIEKTLAVWLAHRVLGRDDAGTAYRVAGDLGNLAGKAAKTVRHPTARHQASGRPVMVGGPVPDLASPAIAVPDQVADLVLLGDTTSDDFTTRCALARPSARYAREGRTVRVAWAPPGVDFDDVLRSAE